MTFDRKYVKMAVGLLAEALAKDERFISAVAHEVEKDMAKRSTRSA